MNGSGRIRTGANGDANGDVESLRAGIRLDDGLTQPAQVDVLKGAHRKAALECMGIDEVVVAIKRANADGHALSAGIEDATLLSVTIKEGRKRQVKRMFSAIGHPVIALHRPSFGPLSLGDLPRGAWRALTNEETGMLHAAIDSSASNEGFSIRDDGDDSRG